jgi:hypothetical protein
MTCAEGESLVTLTIDYGAEDPLVIGPDCPGGESGLLWNVLVPPAWDYRRTTAAPSAWVAGEVLLSVVPEVGTLNVTVVALGANSADLLVQKQLLEGAFSAWPYTVTITATDPGESPVIIGGPWEGHPAIPNWGDVSMQNSGLYAAEGVVVATLNPTGAP